MSGLGIVVVSFGSSELLRANLAAIDRAHLTAATVVVVDNWTTDAERRAVRALAEAEGWLVEEPASNAGFGAGVNLGAARALSSGCDRLLVLNPDVSIDAQAIVRLIRASVDHPAAALSPRLDRPDGSVWFAGGQLDRATGLTRTRPDVVQQGEDRWLTAACLLVDRAAWELVGGFDERYFLYWEDVDLSQRLLAAGGDLRVVHDVVATHTVGGTQRSVGKSPTYARYMCRNRLLFAVDHADPAARRRWLRHAPRYAWRVMTRDGRRMALRHPVTPLAAIGGTVEGAWLLLAPRRSR